MNKAQLTAITETKLGYSTFRTRLYETKQLNMYLANSSVFLSHSHPDKEFVEKAVVFLRQIGIGVYVDWMDSSMSSITNAETANKIKDKIKLCRKFILLATNPLSHQSGVIGS